ncbi:sulfatase, partial [Candidatus Poribacteria bacterium]|nr:sulfatase [Candidatus Poribacteria bacterium]
MQEDSQRKASSRFMTRRHFLNTGLKIGAAAFTTGLLPRLKAQGENRYNVLFMIVDDLRPMLGCYGIDEMHTPNIDRLAERGTLFNRAYCQYPLCNPSRASILTGLRPETTNVHNNSADYKYTVPDAMDIPQYFMEQGYNTYTIGKIKHYPATTSYAGKPSWLALDVSDDELDDGINAKKTEDLLIEIKDELFFLAVGFDKPHLPFYAPQRYYDLYHEDTFNLPTTSAYPQHAPDYAENSIEWFRIYQDIPSGDVPISNEKTLELIRAYAASTSYMDAQVGRVLRQLDDLGLTEKTVIVFCGDHGFHLGEHGTWRKNTLYEIAARSPLIISVPEQQPSQTDAIAELVDIYPTLCDACELPIPTQLEGLSLIPVIEKPNVSWKTGAISFLRRAGSKSYSLRTNRYRYTEWGPRGKFGYELYDYTVDPNETINVADFPEYSELLEHLRQRLRSGWKNEMPNSAKNPPIPMSIIPWDINNDG